MATDVTATGSAGRELTRHDIAVDQLLADAIHNQHKQGGRDTALVGSRQQLLDRFREHRDTADYQCPDDEDSGKARTK